MIHYTCDCCKRKLDTEELRFIVRLEVYASLDNDEGGRDEDRDHLQELQEILESIEDAQDEDIDSEVYHQVRFDLCSECRKRFVKNPLGRGVTQSLNFSQN